MQLRRIVKSPVFCLYWLCSVSTYAFLWCKCQTRRSNQGFPYREDIQRSWTNQRAGDVQFFFPRYMHGGWPWPGPDPKGGGGGHPPPSTDPKIVARNSVLCRRQRRRRFCFRHTAGGNFFVPPHVSILKILRILWRIQQWLKSTKRLCSHLAHFWATSDSAPALRRRGSPRRQGH